MKPSRVSVTINRGSSFEKKIPAVWVSVVPVESDSSYAVVVDETGAIYEKPLGDIVCDDANILQSLRRR